MNNLYRNILPVFLVLQALFLASPSAARAQEMTCPTPLPVSIDVKPVDTANKINLSSKGVLPVAVLSRPDFDASQFMPVMAHLQDAVAPMDCSGAAAVRRAYSDVNGDGLVDLVFFFRVQDLSFTSSTTEVMLMAHNAEGSHIMGTDAVIVKP